MKTTMLARFFLLFVVIQHGTTLSFGPILSSTGNSAILVFLDIHRNYRDNACADPDWNIFELAQSIYWKFSQENQTGIEVYDTCSSPVRVQSIVRERITTQQCNPGTVTPVSGVLSYSTTVINDILTLTYDALHVVVVDGTSDNTDRTDGQIYVELASKSNIKVFAHILQSLNWTYVTTFSDNHPLSQFEHAEFQRVADDLNICIQYSQFASNWSSNDVDSIKTDGVIIFANELTSLKSIVEKLPNSSTVAIVTHEWGDEKLNEVDNGVVLFDAYIIDVNVSEYMTSAWKQTTLDELLAQYYVINHNCSYVNKSVSNDLSCGDVGKFSAYFDQFTTSRRYQVVQQTLTLMTGVADDMEKNNCTNYHRSCFDPAKVTTLSQYLSAENQTLMEKVPHNFNLTKLKGGTFQQYETFSTSTFTSTNPDVYGWLNGGPDKFPTLCTTWCPSCKRSKCNMASDTLDFEGEYVFIPGDILITGMVPLSQRWNRLSTENVCTGLLLDDSFDVQSEAFLYAVLSAQSRHGNRMQNLSVGALLFDTCNDVSRASQILLSFESCMFNFKRMGSYWKPSPSIVPAYLIIENNKDYMGVTETLDKLAVGVSDKGNVYRNNEILFQSSAFEFEILAMLLHKLNLTNFGLVTSNTTETLQVHGLFEATRSRDICISFHEIISAQNTDIMNNIKKSTANVVVILATAGDVDTFFRSLTSRSIVKTWILLETRENWFDISSFPLPLGSVVLSPDGKHNSKFSEHLTNLLDSKPIEFISNNQWIEKYRMARSQNSSFTPTISGLHTDIQSADVINSVDITIEAILNAIETVCGNGGMLCPEFLETGAQQVLREFNQIWFDSDAPVSFQTYVINNLQPEGTVEVGRWTDQQLSLNKEKLRSYDSLGNPLTEFRQSYCFVSPCGCLNINVTENQTDMAKVRQLDEEMGYVNSSEEFKKDLWVLIVVIIAGTGSLLTLILMIYIMCKVCAGALMRRYLALGILLLVAMVFLFLSVLPFLFTPSENVCGMRYFAHGFSYAFCYAIILTKMMSLRDYKYIGLGGEISRINQMLTVFFITAVQIAIGVQWWVLRTPVVFSETIFEADENDALIQTTYYACDFVRKDFVSYHSYVIFVLVLCCLYSLGVRNEKKNMNEARLLLICSWFCLILWIGIVVTLLVLDREYLEAICAIGILANALSMVVFIYLPKLTAISRLQYDVSDQKTRKENGYKLDPDFQFERPYSLPGTLHSSSITDKALTYPRSLATFDTSLSY